MTTWLSRSLWRRSSTAPRSQTWSSWWMASVSMFTRPCWKSGTITKSIPETNEHRVGIKVALVTTRSRLSVSRCLCASCKRHVEVKIGLLFPAFLFITALEHSASAFQSHALLRWPSLGRSQSVCSASLRARSVPLRRDHMQMTPLGCR